MSPKSVTGRAAPIAVAKKKIARTKRASAKRAAVKPVTTKPGNAKRATAKSPRSHPKHSYILRLFVAGASARSSQAIQRVRELCATELKGSGKLDVIDIYQQPALARANQIVATPTLIIVFPPPVRRFIGNLANTTGLLVQLAVSPKGKLKV
jgi:circadian clock protein KaiB